MRRISLFLIAIFLFLAIKCEYEKIPLPDYPDTVSIVFAPGNEKYIPVNPPWEGEKWNFNRPKDIFISVDDYIFVSDSGNSRIVVLTKSGEIVDKDNFGNDFSSLISGLSSYGTKEKIYPIGIAIDSKLNLFITNLSNKVYVWNQFVNNKGIDSVATEVIYYNPETGEKITITDFSSSTELETEGYTLYGAIFLYNERIIDSLLSIHTFYQDRDRNSKFYGVGVAPFGENTIYLTDVRNNRVVSVKLERSAYVKLKDGTTVWLHKGVFQSNAATPGTGAGTVNDPRGIFVDDDNNIYYTQIGENFGVHRIRRLSTGNWISAFSLGVNEIMNLGLFTDPYDVVVDDKGNIFVSNSGRNEIMEFDSRGSFLRKAGLREVQIDTTINDTILLDSGEIEVVQKDTIITRYYNDILNHPEGLFVDDGILYVIDTGNDRIVRYKLSTDIDIEIPE